MSHFKKYWDKDTHKDILNTVQKKVRHLLFLISNAYDYRSSLNVINLFVIKV